MRGLRPILLALVLAGIFYYFNTHAHESPLPSTPLVVTQVSGAQSFDSEEQDNLCSIRKVIP